ncbi:MAG: glycosyltransferase family 87 protein [Polyangiales bacterium]
MSEAAAKLGIWAWIALWVATGTVMVADSNRFLPPVGEKYADKVGKGGADLLPSFDSAYAWLDGQNPYHYKLKDRLPLPFAEHEEYTYQYPPTHFLVYVPFVWFAGENFLRAARLQYFVQLIATVVLALAVLDLIGAAVPLGLEQRCALLPAITLVLLLNPGSQLGLERGQSDVFTAGLCWWSVALWLRSRYLIAAFLAVTAGLLKGYGVPFGAGLLLLGLRRDVWRKALVGSVLALVLLLAPVARYIPEAIGVFPTRARMFWSNWNNQSLHNLIYTLSPKLAAPGRKVLIVVAGLVTLLAWLRAWRAQQSGTPEAQAISLSLYTCASLIFILAFSQNSLVYNVVLVLPGALFVALTQSRLPLTATPRAAAVLGSVLSLTMFCLCAMSIFRIAGRRPFMPDWPLHALGQLLLLGVITVISLRRPGVAGRSATPGVVRVRHRRA